MGSVQPFFSLPENGSLSLARIASRYRASFENARDGVNIFSLDRRIIDVNKRMVQLSGYSREELIGMRLSDLYPEALSDEGHRRMERLKDKQNLPLFESFLLTKSQKRIPVEIAVTYLEGWEEDELVCQGNVRDISLTRSVMNRLKKSEAKYRSLLDNIDVGIARSTPGAQGRFIEVNPAMVEMLGYPESELFNANLSAFHENRDRAAAILEMLATQGRSTEKEIRLIRKDNSVITAAYTGIAVKDSNGRILFVDEILENITEKKRIEDEVQKNEKLRSIGDLAGGIAHDFNNIMTGLFGNLALAKMELAKDSRAHEYLSNAEACMKEGISLTKQLLTFAKGGDPIKERINMAAAVEDAVLFTLSGSSIRLNFSAPKDLWRIEADKSQITQVLSNMTMNARQAMPRGGEFSVLLENSHFLKDNLLTLSKGRYVKLTLKDNGAGIHEKDLARIFDPYFTTRKNGSGMGLAICYSIIKKHHGQIFVASQVGLGTTITIYLPAADAGSQKEIQMTQTKSNSALSRQFTILVMDDEPHIRLLLKKMLEKFGYHVELAADGDDAIKSFQHLRAENRTPDLVIMDLTIPGGMGGKEASQKLLEIVPDAAIVVSSGYSNDPVMADYKSFGLKGIIPKPYRMEELKKILSSILPPQ